MNFNEFLNEGSTSSYGGRAGLTKDETLKIAQKFADAAASVDPEKGKWAVNKRTLEEDGFDLDYNDEEYDGGSYNIYKNGNVVNMALRENPVLGKIGDDIKTIAKGFKKMMTNESVVTEGTISPKMANSFKIGDEIKTQKDTYTITAYGSKTGATRDFEAENGKGEQCNLRVSLRGTNGIQVAAGKSLNFPEQQEMLESVTNEAKLFLGLSTNNYPAGTIGRYRIESTAINLRKVADLSKDSWSKYSRAFTDSEIGFEKSSDRKEALDSIQKSFDNGQNDIREFGLNESVVDEGTISPKMANSFKIGDKIKTQKDTYTITGYGSKTGATRDFEAENEKGEQCNLRVSLRGTSGIQVAAGKSLNFPEQQEMLESVVNERNVTIKRQYTDKNPAVTVGKAAKVRNRMLEAIKDGKVSQEDFNNILKEMTTDSKRWLRRNAQCFNVSEDGISLSKTGSRILKNVMVAEATEKAPKIWVPGGFDKAISKYPNSKITRKIVLDAALKWDVNPEDAIQYVEFAWMVDLDENKKTNDMNTKFIYESFADFVANKLNEGTLNEAFKSAKLANLFSVGSAGTKDLAGAFYNFSKLAIDKIEDYDIIEMDPQTARKEKRANGVYFYIVNNQKENPYIEGSIPSTYNNGIIQSNTLLAITNGSNEWYSTSYQSYSRAETLKITKTREDAAGFDKRDSKRYDGSGITSLTKVAELADIVYVIDLDVLKARYSTTSLQFQRAEDKRGATAFKSDKDFKMENKARYNQILAQKASEMPMDSIVLGAIDTLATQIKDALSKGEKGRYGELIVGIDPKGREIKMSDASNLMRNILDEYNRYVGYVVDAEKEVATGYSGKFYEGRLKESSKTIVDYVKKVDAKNYAW